MTLEETLVMTATFKPADTPGLIVRDERERVLHYLCALVSWARTAHVARIVFGENGNTRFDFSKVVEHVEAAGKAIEVIVFDGNKDSERYGKGFGEGEILEYLYTHSRLLHQHAGFYKVTGRLFVANFDAVSEATTSADAFQRKQPKDSRPRPSKVITTFFKCSLALFTDRLLDAYREVDDRAGIFIEHAYFNRLQHLELANFGVKPELVGQQASTGRVYAAYDQEIIELARSFMRPQKLS
jgi:hypothetical protein